MTYKSKKRRKLRIEIVDDDDPCISRVMQFDEKKQEYVDPRTIWGCLTKPFRARKYLRAVGRRKKVQADFGSIEEARFWRGTDTAKKNRSAVFEHKYTFGDLVADWSQWATTRYSKSVMEQHSENLPYMAYLFDLPMEDLTVEDTDAWRLHITESQDGNAKCRAFIKRMVKLMKAILNWYRDHKNPRYRSPIVRQHSN